MELTKQDTKMTKGVAVIFMVLLHLFCRINDLPYECLKLPFAGGAPLVYYIGLFGDCCVAIYCFCSGYALEIINTNSKNANSYYKGRFTSVLLLLLNYWIVLIVFSLIGILIKNPGIPNNPKQFISHFFLLDNTYNSAWWFVLTYILLTIVSRPIYLLINKINPIVINIACVVIYFLAYFQRINGIVKFDIKIIDWILRQITLLGTSILPFIWGMYFSKYSIMGILRNCCNNHLKNKQMVFISVLILIVMVVCHGIVQSLVVAPITATLTIVLFNLVNKNKIIVNILLFVGSHSTNIWLTHMFFIYAMFNEVVFKAKYPLFIFLLTMLLSIFCSYVIDLVNKPMAKLVKHCNFIRRI